MRHPNFVKDALLDVTQISVANANRNGSGTTVAISTGVAGGKRISGIRVTPEGTVTQGMIRIYVKVGAGVARLYDEKVVEANAVGATVPVEPIDFVFPDGFNLPDETYALHASTERGENFNVFVHGGGYGTPIEG